MYAMMGRECHLFEKLSIPDSTCHHPEDCYSPSADSALALNLEHRLEHIRQLVEVVQPSLLWAQKDRRLELVSADKPETIVPDGSFVILKKNVKPRKLNHRYQGLYRVLSRTRTGNYVLECLRGYKPTTPVNPLRIKVISDELAQDLLTNPPEAEVLPDPEDDEDVAEVECVINHRTVRGVIHYLVKWVDCPAEENSWVPEQAMNCPDLIRVYFEGPPKPKAAVIRKALASLGETSHSVPHEDLISWIGDHTGNMDVDLFARDNKNPLCLAGAACFETDGAMLAYSAKTLWVNPPWRYFALLGSWLNRHARGKFVFSLIPEWRVRHMQDWQADCLLCKELPSSLAVWFTWPNGQPRPKPAWKCFLMCHLF